MAPAASTPAVNKGTDGRLRKLADTSDSYMVPTRPLWVDPDTSAYPAVERDMAFDVVIIGGGISGVAAARWLFADGVRNVALLEGRTVCSGASGRNAGFVMAVSPENFPSGHSESDLLLAREVWQFTATNQRMIEDVIEEFDLEVEYRRLGSVGLAAYEQEWNWIVSSTAVADSAGVHVDLIAREDLPSDWLRENYYGGAWYASNGEIHPAKFVRGLAARLHGQGLQIFEQSPVRSLTSYGNGPATLSIGSHTIRADTVIVATNAYTADLIPEFAELIRPTRGQVLSTYPLDSAAAEFPVYANDGFQYWRQRPDGRLIVGGWRDMDIPRETGTVETLHAGIQARLTEVAEGLLGRRPAVEYRWSGIMGFTADKRPLVGPVPRMPDVYLCAGFSGHGLAMAFHSAKVAVDWLRGQPNAYASVFRADRFPTAVPSVDFLPSAD